MHLVSFCLLIAVTVEVTCALAAQATENKDPWYNKNLGSNKSLGNNIDDMQLVEQHKNTSSKGDNSWADDDWDSGSTASWRWSGFTEFALGRRLKKDPAIGNAHNSLEEFRQQVELNYSAIAWQFSAKADVIADDITGEFEFDLRKAELAWSPSKDWDLKLGSQVLTWGTGQYLFLNDLFPKDWQSFLQVEMMNI